MGKKITIIGAAEKVEFPEFKTSAVARIDTGARTSTIWAKSARKTDQGLEVFFAGFEQLNDSKEPTIFKEFDTVAVASSNGSVQVRYKVKLLVRLGHRRVRAWFTLADRSTQVYPILIGRNVLRGKFIVDVSQGTKALLDVEHQRTAELMRYLTSEDK